ncbi:MAG: hypothetical protein ACK4IX_00685, partial [Candidatus Sericytochromatia bacterium]
INVSEESTRLHYSIQVNKYAIEQYYIPFSNLGKSKEYIIDDIFNPNYITFNKTNKKEYNILFFRYKDNSNINSIYFIENNINRGYILFEHPYWDISFLEKIKEVTKESNYLKNKLKVPNNVKIKVYENKENKFVERYIIAEKDNQFYLLLDSFYPKILEKEVEEYIIEQVNKNLDSMKE